MIDYAAIPEDLDKPKLKRDWESRLVRLRRDTETRGGRLFTAGTVMKVLRNFGGLNLQMTAVCPYCGLGERCGIYSVHERAVDLLPKGTSEPSPASAWPAGPAPLVYEHNSVRDRDEAVDIWVSAARLLRKDPDPLMDDLRAMTDEQAGAEVKRVWQAAKKQKHE